MNDFKIKVTCALVKGYTEEDAEVDGGVIGEHIYDIKDCCCAEGACEKALDEFHGHNAIGVLDYVEVDTEVLEGKDLRAAMEALLADHIAMSKERWMLAGKMISKWKPLPVQETAQAALKEKYQA